MHGDWLLRESRVGRERWAKMAVSGLALARCSCRLPSQLFKLLVARRWRRTMFSKLARAGVSAHSPSALSRDMKIARNVDRVMKATLGKDCCCWEHCPRPNSSTKANMCQQCQPCFVLRGLHGSISKIISRGPSRRPSKSEAGSNVCVLCQQKGGLKY